MSYATLEQKRAKKAWEIVQSVKSNDKIKKDFGAQARKLPIRILSSGLGPSLAFLNAKKYAPELVRVLNEWIEERPWATSQIETSRQDASLMERIIQGDSEFLSMATDESLALLQWIVRFAEAEGLVE